MRWRRVLGLAATAVFLAGTAAASTIWGGKAGDTFLVLRTTPALMDAYLSPTGFAQLWPGTEALTLPAYRAGVCWLWARYDAYRIVGTPFESWPAGVKQLRVDSLGVTAANVIAARLGPASSATAGGAIRIVDGVTFATLAGALADKPGGASGTRGGVLDPDSARLFLGRFMNNVTLNDPSLDRARTSSSHDVSIQGLNITETEAAHNWQTVWSGNGITGAAGFDRAVAGEWHDHELAAGAGNGLNVFRGPTFVTQVNSAVFEKTLTGMEVDTNYRPTTTDTLDAITGIVSYAGPSSGAGAASVTANPVIALQGVGMNNGTGNVAALHSVRADAQVGGPVGNVLLMVAADPTGLGTITGGLYSFYAAAKAFPSGTKYAFYGAATSGPGVFEDSLRSNRGLYVGGQFVNKILRASATLDFDLTAATCQDLTVTVTGAALGDEVFVGAPNGSIVTDETINAWVSAANTVTIRACDGSLAGNPASGTYKVTVFQ